MNEEATYKYYLEIESSIHLLTAREIAIALGIHDRNSDYDSDDEFLSDKEYVFSSRILGRVLSALERQSNEQPIYYKAKNLLRVYRVETIFKLIKFIEDKLPEHNVMDIVSIRVTPYTVLYVHVNTFKRMKYKLNV